MFSIGDFARHGSVSVRMLRHYDALGLLRPARTDPYTGYRFYEAGQLTRLNRLLALKDLGFTLRQVRQILDEDVSPGELRGMLRLRHAELEEEARAAAGRLARAEARLRLIESEGQMPTDDIVVKSLPAVRVAELTALAPGFRPEDIGPVIQPLYRELHQRLRAAGVVPAGPDLAFYEEHPDGTVTVHAAAQIASLPGGGHGLAVVDLPAVEKAATVVHRGPMDAVMPAVQALARWIGTSGHHSAGPPRELYLSCEGGPDTWVTELQEPVTPA
ncbi:MerR family transcriptional regulator [Streptomyces sp. S07_1.15]|uniref:MerR family transcriptional regulator n=1 Tax=Streptomyces sp. S07_1.15 TaxID=2873925 RepID=UPI001D14E092|nr:MerR family transcriptional regulator [Streptomyces sp. S07_1.15]MCC3650006.1 MerR family transcriptional regulator [Streptomyces sp. S07_1.15]